MSGKSPFLKNKAQLMGLSFSKTTDWDIRFLAPDVPVAFRKFFPAQKVVEPVFSHTTHALEIGNFSLELPSSFELPELKIDFYDNDKCELEEYLRNWVNTTILGGLLYVSPVDSVVKNIEVYRKNSRGGKVFSTIYGVYPKGELERDHTSDPDFVVHSVTFNVATVSRKK